MARILIVDDAAFMRMMLKDILTKGGFEIAGEAADGNEAVAKYNELKPDLVTLDITMPNKDGIQALKEIKAADPNFFAISCPIDSAVLPVVYISSTISIWSYCTILSAT
mgnify:CR=1 FL=1